MRNPFRFPRSLLGARCGDGSSTSSVTPRSLASFSRTASRIHAPRGWSPDICPMRSSTRGDSLTPTGGPTLSSAAGLPSPSAALAAVRRVSRSSAWAAEHGGHLQPLAYPPSPCVSIRLPFRSNSSGSRSMSSTVSPPFVYYTAPNDAANSPNSSARPPGSAIVSSRHAVRARLGQSPPAASATASSGIQICSARPSSPSGTSG